MLLHDLALAVALWANFYLLAAIFVLTVESSVTHTFRTSHHPSPGSSFSTLAGATFLDPLIAYLLYTPLDRLLNINRMGHPDMH